MLGIQSFPFFPRPLFSARASHQHRPRRLGDGCSSQHASARTAGKLSSAPSTPSSVMGNSASTGGWHGTRGRPGSQRHFPAEAPLGNGQSDLCPVGTPCHRDPAKSKDCQFHPQAKMAWAKMEIKIPKPHSELFPFSPFHSDSKYHILKITCSCLTPVTYPRVLIFCWISWCCHSNRISTTKTAHSVKSNGIFPSIMNPWPILVVELCSLAIEQKSSSFCRPRCSHKLISFDTSMSCWNHCNFTMRIVFHFPKSNSCFPRNRQSLWQRCDNCV